MRSRDPRFKLAAFALLLPVLMASPLFSPVWLAGVGLVGLVTVAASLPWAFVGRGLWRLRWLFLVMVLTHGWFTPGTPVWSLPLALSREGLVAGGQQSLRLVLLALLAWCLTRTTTPMELVGAFQRFSTVLQRCGLPMERGLSILAFCLTGLPRFMAEAQRVREGMAMRMAPVVVAGRDGRGGGAVVVGRLERLAFAGEALLLRLLRDLRRREEGLRVRGFETGLPPVRLNERVTGWRDWSLLLPPMVLLGCW